MSKYLFDAQEIERELITLLAIVKASKANHDFLDPIGKLLPIFFVEWGIIQENLIATAIKLRMIDDQFKKNSTQPIFQYETVGTLKKEKSEINLSFREACNKIIHAIKFLPKTAPEKQPERNQYYLEKIVLEGKNGKEKWWAELHINKYVCDGLLLIKQYDEDWSISSR